MHMPRLNKQKVVQLVVLETTHRQMPNLSLHLGCTIWTKQQIAISGPPPKKLQL
jgi:hypothetical protein